MKPLLRLILVIALFGVLSPPARADQALLSRLETVWNGAIITTGEEADSTPTRRVRLEYLKRESVVEYEDYLRFELGWDTNSRWINPGGGMEYRVRFWQLRSYWFGDDIRITDRTRLSLRLCHLQYEDWEAAINLADFYFSYRRGWFKGALGLGYAALVFEPENYRNPFQFDSQAPESRIIYDLSLAPRFFDDRIELEAGLRNFDNFEYHGADDTGYHFTTTLHLDRDTSLSLFYERRYGGVFVGAPTLTRITWLACLEHRF